MIISRFKNWLKERLTTVIVFSYGIIIGTSVPIVLARCATGGSSCANCGGFCALGLSVLPLVLFMSFKNQIRRFSQRLFPRLKAQNELVARKPGE